jgi:peptide/nickel transport system substrate-binding protein
VFSFKAAMNPLVVDAAALRNYYEDVADVQATDDRTVVITMIKPYFMAEYQLGDLRILPKHLMDPKGLTDKYSVADCRDMNIAMANAAMQEFATWFGTPEVKREPQFNIGTGPWIYEEWKTGEYVRLMRNDKYWNAANANQWQKPMADKLVFTVVTDRSTAVVKMKNQEMDFMDFVPPVKFVEEVDTVATPHLVKKPYPQSVYTYIGWNTRRPQFSDKRVRRALGMLVDRDALIKQVNYGLASIQNTPLYSTRPEYDKSIKGLTYDPTGAKKLLAEAGWTDSNGDGVLDKTINGRRTDFTLTFLLNNGNETRERIALICVDEFKKVGIKASVQKIDWSVFLETTRRHAFDAYIGSWINDDIPSDPYQIWHSSQASNKGSNMVGFINKRADELLELNRIEFDEAKRAAYMKEFQAIVTEEQPYTFLWAPMNPGVYNRRLQNVQFHTPRPGYLPTEWWIPKGQWKYASAP